MSEARVFLVSWDVDRFQAYLYDLLPPSTGRIFCVEREGDEDTLIRRLDDGGFRGMSFIPVWSSSEGPAPLNLHEVV